MDNDFIEILLKDDAEEILKFINNNGKRKPYSPIFFLKKDENQIKEENQEVNDNE